MTFTEIVTAICDTANITSPDGITRVGSRVNSYYKRITASLGLNPTRRTTVQATVTVGVSTLTFTSCEKVINVFDRSVTPYRRLTEVSMEEIRAGQLSSLGTPRRFAIQNAGASSVTILLDCVPEDAFVLYADGYALAATLSGSQVPVLPEDFHDLLVLGPLSDEYRKMNKPALAKDVKGEYETLLSDLRFFLAKSSYADNHFGKTEFKTASVGSGGGSGGSGSGADGSASYEQTGLITFNRQPSLPPFAVTAPSAKVDNLNADLIDGYDSTELARLDIANTFTRAQTITHATTAYLNIGATGSATPILYLSEGSQAANQKLWSVWVNGGIFKFSATNDTGGILLTPITMNRSGGIGFGDNVTAVPHDGSTVVGHVKSLTFVDNLWRWELGTSGAPVTGSSNAIFIRSDLFDAINTSDATLWTDGAFFQHTQSGGNGNRSALYARMNVSGSPTRSASTFSGAFTAFTEGAAAGGTYFGSNPYCRLITGATGVCMGEEVDTDAQVNCTAKIGIQIADIATSVGTPSVYNQAFKILKQVGAYGYDQGIVFETSPAAGVRTTGTLIHATSGGAYGYGIDFGQVTFSGGSIILPNNSYIAARNAANNATIGVVALSSSNIVVLGDATHGVAVLGGQVSFPATANPSSDANTLDDYEENTWLPVLGGTGGTSGQTYTTQIGHYTKIGNTVTCVFELVLSNKGTITTNCQISNLPFFSMTGGGIASCSLRYGALNTNWVNVMAVVAANSAVALVRGAQAAATNNDTALTTADITNTTFLSGTIIYRTA